MQTRSRQIVLIRYSVLPEYKNARFTQQDLLRNQRKSLFSSLHVTQPWQADRVRRPWSANRCQGCVLDERAGMMAKALVWRPAHPERTQNIKKRITNRKEKGRLCDQSSDHKQKTSRVCSSSGKRERGQKNEDWRKGKERGEQEQNGENKWTKDKVNDIDLTL